MSSEWGIDPDLDPRSFEAAVQWRAVAEAESIVQHVAQPERNIVGMLLDALKREDDPC